MKIVISDNFGRDLFQEVLVAERVNPDIGHLMVNEWNDMYWDENSDHYLKLVADDYKLYDGYAELLGELEELEDASPLLADEDIRMKIVAKDNNKEDLIEEEIIASNVQEFTGQQIIDLWNKKYQYNHLGFYLKLVKETQIT